MLTAASSPALEQGLPLARVAGLIPPSVRMFARRKKPTYWDYSVNCSGAEAHLSSCKLAQLAPPRANASCPGGQPVVVSCVPGRAFAPSASTGFRKAFRQEVGNFLSGRSLEQLLR